MYPQGQLGGYQQETPGVPRLDGHYLAQVIAVLPEEHMVGVLLPALTNVTAPAFKDKQDEGAVGLKARVMEHRAGPWVGDRDLPRVGDWGLVVFPHGSHDYVVWLGSLYQDFNNLSTGNVQERLSHHDSGVYWRINQAGETEWSHPSGTYVKVGATTTLDQRKRFERDGSTGKRSKDYTIPTKAAPSLHIQHASGATFTVDPTGNITMTSPGTVTVTSTGVMQLTGSQVRIN